MPPKKQLSEIKRAQIVTLSGEGYSQVEIARKMECSRKGVQTTIKRYKETKSFKNRKGQGRKKSTTTREDKSLKRPSLADRRKSSSELAAELRESANKQISARTVRRRLLEVGLKGCKARKKPTRKNDWNLQKKNMKIGHLMIGAKLFGQMKVTLR